MKLLVTYIEARSKKYENFTNKNLINIQHDIKLPVLEITVGHWPFSDQFQHFVDQNPFWLANFTVHFQWDGNQ